jgi:hypothetical protein
LQHFQASTAQNQGALGRHHFASEDAQLLELIVVKVVCLDVHRLATVGFFGQRKRRQLQSRGKTGQVKKFFQGTEIADQKMTCIVRADSPVFSAAFAHLSNQEIDDL